MPIIINPDSIAIESLTSKLNGLESKFTALEKKHSVLQDSIQSLNQTILKADIATSFYDTHLATYTTIFTVIVAIVAASLAAYNIFGIYKPIQAELKEFKEIIFPQHIENLKNENQEQIEELREVNDRLKDSASEGITWGLKAMMNHYQLSKTYSSVVLFAMRYIEHMIDYENVELNLDNIKIYLDYVEYLIVEKNILITDLEDYRDELDTCFKKILTVNNDELIAQSLKCRKDIYENKRSEVGESKEISKSIVPKGISTSE